MQVHRAAESGLFPHSAYQKAADPVHARTSPRISETLRRITTESWLSIEQAEQDPKGLKNYQAPYEAGERQMITPSGDGIVATGRTALLVSASYDAMEGPLRLLRRGPFRFLSR